MTLLDRRGFVRLGLGGSAALGLGALAAGCDSGLGRHPDEPPRLGVLRSTCPIPAPHTTELPRTPVLRPDAGGRITMRQQIASIEVLPGLQTKVFGYEGMFPGPVIEARSGEPVRLTVRNDLPVPTSTHLHGGVTPADSDGGPMDLVVPRGFDTKLLDEAMMNGHSGLAGHSTMPWVLHEDERIYEYPMHQPAATLWYHDHRMDFSAPQVWRGLAGMFLVRDEVEDALDLPSGERELPLLVCDRAFGDDGELLYPSLDPELMHTPGVEDEYMNGVLGDVLLVNGAPSPRTTVARGRYRLRLLNACNARQLALRFTTGSGPNLPFQVIGSDAGLLPAPVERTDLVLAPAERLDLLVDFSELEAGTRVELRNDSSDGVTRVMAFDVEGAAEDVAPLPSILDPDFEVLDPDAAEARSLTK